LTRETEGRPLGWDWVARCRLIGGTPTRELWDEAVSAGEAAVPLMVDVLSRRSFREGEPGDCALLPVHAMRVLTAVRSPAALPALLNVLSDPVDPGLYGEEAAVALARLGGAALAPLEGLFFDRRRDRWIRVGAARALLLCALADRRHRRRVRDAYDRFLRDPGESDGTLVAHVIADVCLMAAEVLLPAVEIAFAAGRVDEGVIDLESARIDLLTRHQRPDAESAAVARRDPGEDYVPWADLAAAMDPEDRASLEAALERCLTEPQGPPGDDD
jgi:hypothetical protein